jgi:hypothetical protein
MSKRLLIGLLICLLPCSIWAEENGARDYWQELNQEQRDSTHYLINSLGRKSKLSLLFSRGSLQEAGEVTGDIHPLRFLAYIRQDADLYDAFRAMRGRVWREFVEGYSESFDTAAMRGSLTDDVLQDFSVISEIPLAKLESYVDQHQWGRLMQHFAGR